MLLRIPSDEFKENFAYEQSGVILSNSLKVKQFAMEFAYVNSLDEG
jgi:hypothetical protein